uniref:Uncharacterized protein n=1 Tax=Oryza nivara TaxID=4536 RepID=A0A0E0G7D9_ORYNI
MGPLPSPPVLPPPPLSLSLVFPLPLPPPPPPRFRKFPISSSSSSSSLARSLAAENPARAGWLVLELQSPAPSQAPYQPRYKLHTVY